MTEEYAKLREVAVVQFHRTSASTALSRNSPRIGRVRGFVAKTQRPWCYTRPRNDDRRDWEGCPARFALPPCRSQRRRCSGGLPQHCSPAKRRLPSRFRELRRR